MLIATGRNPNSDSLNLAAAGIETHGNNGVKVDGQMRTSRAGVYAAGDVTGPPSAAVIAAENPADPAPITARTKAFSVGALKQSDIGTSDSLG